MRTVLFILVVGALACSARAAEQSPLEPFQPDEHTLLLYHFDEGQGAAARDSSKNGYDGEVRGAQWTSGRFGKALLFDGKDDSVYRRATQAMQGLRQITVECWFNQENPAGRQFLAGKDVTFHYDLSEGMHTSMSLYNKGGAEINADGLRHQHLGASLGYAGRGWHHNAVTYDGRHLSFFFDGVLKQRVEAAKDFLLGVESRGLWVGCYIGTEFWYSGKIDELRISDSIRYDPEKRLAAGGKVFEMPGRTTRAALAVRKPQKTGQAQLQVALKHLYGGKAAGWVYLKPPGRPPAIVGQYALNEGAGSVQVDVSDEYAGPGTYVLGLVPTDGAGYFAVTGATLAAGGKQVAQWSGEARSRRTFQPPVLVPLRVAQPAGGESKRAAAPVASGRVLLLPGSADRLGGDIQVEPGEDDAPPTLAGSGFAEYWLDQPVAASYRVHLRYASSVPRPCDIVIDGKDLNAYDMCAVNRTDTSRPRDAFWEYQGQVTLAAGAHWIRIQDVVPDIVALRLEPAPAAKPAAVPWARYPVPKPDFLSGATWVAQTLFGAPAGTRVESAAGVRFATTFTNANTGDLFAGDAVRLVHRGQFDLEPFGRLKSRFEGSGSGHVLSLWAVDVKGDEKLLWRVRDTEAGPQEVSVPVSFEGNDVFDPAHVVAICLDLDEGNVRATTANRFAGALLSPVFERRDTLAPPAGLVEMLQRARVEARPPKPPEIGGPGGPSLRAAGFRPWTKPVVPEEHPLYETTEPKPVTRKTMGYDLHYTGARGIGADHLDDYHKRYNFGDVCWPHIGICPLRKNFPDDAAYKKALQEFEERLKDVRDRGLYLFDIWGYVPYEPGFPWTVAPEHHEILTRVFQDRFLGYDNGEQDGRYIGSYAGRGKAANRREGWDDFVKWDEKICGDAMNFMNATGSLNFSHYYGERGARLLGLETAQGLPSDTLLFAFLRGAGKQYGRLTYQATSIWNRYGYNIYSGRKTEGANGYGYGPNRGCSLSLHKRLFFAGYTGGDCIAGTETAQFTADRLENGAAELSPLGRQHLEIAEFTRKHPDRGVVYTPVAFLLDFHNGWNMPRHLYRPDKYKIWGKFPYEKGDYLIDGIFRMVWPGYEDASYLRNERGFVANTPYGDIFDVLTNRCHPDILKQYPCVMLLGDVEMTPEAVRNLTAYVQAGGDLILDARHAKAFPEAITGVRLGAEAKACLSRSLATGKTFAEQPYTYTVLTAGTARPLLVNEAGHPLMALNRAGKGRVVVGAADYWMTDALTYAAPEIVNMEPPHTLLQGVRAVLSGYFDSFLPVEVAPAGLNVRVNCYAGDPKRLLVSLTNNDLFADWRGALRVRLGAVASARELRSGKALPAGKEIALTVPAGDVVLVEVRLR